MEKEIKPVGDSSESNKKNVAVEALKEIIEWFKNNFAFYRYQTGKNYKSMVVS